jgi:hypothetical protein
MTNQLNLTFEEKVKLVTNANHTPKGDGVNFLHFKEVEIDKILQRTGNVLLNLARSEGTNKETIAQFVDRINEGRYLFIYEQPVVKQLGNGFYQLVCGEHRLQAHKGVGRKTMFVAVVEFDTEEDEIIFQSNENDEDDEYVKQPRTQSDVILTLSNMIDKGIIDINDDKSINSRLIRLNQKTNDFPFLRKQLRAKYGIITAVKSYEDKDRKDWCSTYKPQIKFSSRSSLVSLDGVAYQSKTFKGGKGTGGLQDLDYDPRCFFDSCHLLQQEKVTKVHNICSVNKCTSEKIPKVRQYKREKLMQEMLDKCIRIVDDYRSGKYDPVNDVLFYFTPQISGVDDMEDFS